MSELPDLAAFSKCVGEAFRARPGAEDPLEFELVEAEALPTHKGAPREEPFSLVFRGPPGRALAQQQYELEHERLGEIAVFLVPVGESEKGTLLEAVFN